MPRSKASGFLEALTYLYASLAVVDTGELAPELQGAVRMLTDVWPLDLTDTERDETASTAFGTVTADVLLEGAILYGTPRFVGHCIGLTRALNIEGRGHVLHDLISLASPDGQLSMAECAFIRALEKAWSTGIAIPDPGAITPRMELPSPPSPFEVEDAQPTSGEPGPAAAFGAPALPLPEPQAWWWEHMESLEDATVEKGADATTESRTARHRRLWDEMNAWVAELTAVALGDAHVNWANNPNQYQIGKLSYTYWARLAPQDDETFRDAFHVGLQLSKRLKWVDELAEPLAAYENMPVLTLWASTNDRLIERLPEAQARLMTYGQLQLDLLLSNPELWSRGGALVRHPSQRGNKSILEPATTYLAARQQGALPDASPDRVSLFSPLVTLEQVRANPAGVSRMVSDYIRLLAQPVVAARPAGGVAPRDNPQSASTSRVATAPPSATAEQSLQQRLAAAMMQRYPDAEVKKIDKDNFLDIHLPTVHPKRGTHLFFNTARGGIKIGFQCRDEEFVARALQDEDSLESFANGIRLAENPSFADADAALRAAQDFIAKLVAAASGSQEDEGDTVTAARALTATADQPSSDDEDVSDEGFSDDEDASADKIDDIDAILASLGSLEDDGDQDDDDADDTDDAEVEEDTGNETSVSAINALALSHDGTKIAIATNQVSTMHVAPFGESFGHHLHGAEVTSVAWSPDGAWIASGGGDSSIRFFDFDAEDDFVLEGHTDWVRGIAFSPDGTWLVSGGDDGMVRVWDVAERVERMSLEAHPDWVRAVAVSPDGRCIATACDDGRVRIWQAEGGSLMATLEGHEGWVTALAFAPHGAWLVSGSQDRTVRCWRLSDGMLLHTLRAHTDCVRAVAVHPDGQRIASVGDDGVARLWDATTGRLQRNLLGAKGALNAVAFAPDGTQVITGGADAIVRFFDLESGFIAQATGSLDYQHLRQAPADLYLPDRFSGWVYLDGLRSAKELSIPQGFCGWLGLNGLTRAEDLLLPEDFTGGLSLNGLRSAEGLVFPRRMPRILSLTGLKTSEGLRLPMEIGDGTPLLLMPDTLRDRLEIPSGVEVQWMTAPSPEPSAVRTGLALPDEMSAALAEASPWLDVDDLEENRRGGDGLRTIPNHVLSAGATAALCARIRRDRVIPVWVPSELHEHFEPFHKWNKVCWLIPWAVLQNGMNGPICVELQGLSIPNADDEFSLGIDIDQVREIPSTTSNAFSKIPGGGTDDPHWREWTLPLRDGNEVTFYEYQPDDDAGFHLDIAAAIFEARWPEIEEFRDSPIVVHNPDGVQWKTFETLEEVVAWALEGDEGA